jgi:hypothetical protein
MILKPSPAPHKTTRVEITSLFGEAKLLLDETPSAPYRQPGTLRVAVFLWGVVLGTVGREVVIKLPAAWGGPSKHKPPVEATLDWLKVASPKLVPPLDRLASEGGMIRGQGAARSEKVSALLRSSG